MEIITCVLAYVILGGLSLIIWNNQKAQKAYIKVYGKEMYQNGKIWMLFIILYFVYAFYTQFSIWILLCIFPLALLLYVNSKKYVGLGKDGLCYHNDLMTYKNIAKFHFGRRGNEHTLTIKGQASFIKNPNKLRSNDLETIEVIFQDEHFDEVYEAFKNNCKDDTESYIEMFRRMDRAVEDFDEDDKAYYRAKVEKERSERKEAREHKQ